MKSFLLLLFTSSLLLFSACSNEDNVAEADIQNDEVKTEQTNDVNTGATLSEDEYNSLMDEVVTHLVNVQDYRAEAILQANDFTNDSEVDLNKYRENYDFLVDMGNDLTDEIEPPKELKDSHEAFLNYLAEFVFLYGETEAYLVACAEGLPTQEQSDYQLEIEDRYKELSIEEILK